MQTFRCPVDDTVFQTQNIHKVPTLQGHPECPGPECRKNFKGYKGAGDVEPVIAPVAPAKHEARHDGAGVSTLDAPPAGQGW
jgi:hypothetical protein